MSLRDKNLIIKVLARDLSDLAKCSSIAFSRSLTLTCFSIESRMPVDMCPYEHNGEAVGSFPLFIKSHDIKSAGRSDSRWLILPNSIVKVHTP